MKIAIAQIRSKKGDTSGNLKQHIQRIQTAVELKADLILFPELSLTSYEPTLAETMAWDVEDPFFEPFQILADQHQICICIGMPIRISIGIHIGMLIFQANQTRQCYTKQMLHPDETLYFVKGSKPLVLKIQDRKIAFGICYETLQETHFAQAKALEADIYLASVAKSSNGIDKAYKFYPKMAKDHQLPVLMCNTIGSCDDFMAAGKSGVWNHEGKVVGQLDTAEEGFLIYDTHTAEVESLSLRIQKGNLSDLEALYPIYRRAKIALDTKDIHQWTDNYPTKAIIENDLQQQHLHTLCLGQQKIGAIVLNEIQDPEYGSVPWTSHDSKVLVIHRLMIDPEYQNRGYATLLMDFAEQWAVDHAYDSIRLDAYSPNRKVIEFYLKRNYHIRGEVYFPEREFPFHCMEKEIRRD